MCVSLKKYSYNSKNNKITKIPLTLCLPRNTHTPQKAFIPNHKHYNCITLYITTTTTITSIVYKCRTVVLIGNKRKNCS